MYSQSEKPESGLEIFVSAFIKDRETEVEKITHLMNVQDFAEIKKITHKWIGYSIPYGFGALVGFAKDLDKYIDSVSYKEAREILPQIIAYLSYKKKSLENAQ